MFKKIYYSKNLAVHQLRQHTLVDDCLSILIEWPYCKEK